MLDKLRLADRCSRDADAASPSVVETEEGATKKVSPRTTKQNQAIRWYFTALLLTSEEMACEGGLVPLLCNRLASVWAKMRNFHVALRWSLASLKLCGTDFHAHVGRCQALLELGRNEEVADAGAEALAVLSGACHPIKKIMAAARDRERLGDQESPESKGASWRLCGDLTVEILSFLGKEDLTNTRQVCKQWSAITCRIEREGVANSKPSLFGAFKRASSRSRIPLSLGKFLAAKEEANYRHWSCSNAKEFAPRAVAALDAEQIQWALLRWAELARGRLYVGGNERSLLGIVLDKIQEVAEDAAQKAKAVDFLKACLESGCNPNARITREVSSWAEEGDTVTKGMLPLEVALNRSQRDVAQVLLEHGADPMKMLTQSISSERLDSLEALIGLCPYMTDTKRGFGDLLGSCIESGWLDGIRFCLKAGALSRFPSIVDGLIEKTLERLLKEIALGVSDAVWAAPGMLPFTMETVSLLMPYRNTAGAGLNETSSAMKTAKHLDGKLWSTNLQKMLRGEAGRASFELYSVNIKVDQV